MPTVTEPDPQATSSHMMKTTKRGRPYLKDTLDLFATLIVSLQLGPHKQFFRTFPHSFTTDEAAQNLASLKFSQSNRGPDPREPSRIVTTTTTTTFSMTRDMAKAMCQHFMDARLIENATDPTSNLFKDRGTYQLTPKGLHVLERFISKNGINADHLQPVFSSQPICIKLLHLERRSSDDEIIVTQSVITALFRRFVGRAPNYPPPPDKPLDVFQKYNERSKGIPLHDTTRAGQSLSMKCTILSILLPKCFLRKALEDELFNQPDPYDLAETDRADTALEGVQAPQASEPVVRSSTRFNIAECIKLDDDKLKALLLEVDTEGTGAALPSELMAVDKENHEYPRRLELDWSIEREMYTTERAQPLMGKPAQVYKHCFAAVAALEWLCDFTSVVGREEAAEMAAQFVRFGLITLVSDKRKNNDSAIIFTVRGSAPGGNSPVSQQGEFRCTAKAIYRVTDEGRRLAHWETSRPQGVQDSPTASSTNLTAVRSSEDGSVDSGSTEAKKGSLSDAKIHRRISLAEKLNANYDAGEKKNSKESNTDRLRYILEEPGLRSLFREFLRGNFCEENLSFWLDVQDFKKKFNITSSAMAATPITRPGNRNTPGQAAMERHHESLINTAFVIYNTYLAPSSQCELNIDHGLRNELVKYLEEVVTNLTGKAFQGRVEPEQANAFNATQLQTMIRLYERIQIHVFRLMATDSVPKFIKTPKFLAMRNWVEDFDPTENDIHLLSVGPASPPGLNNSSDEVGGAYITISQQASEREHRQAVESAAAQSVQSHPS